MPISFDSALGIHDKALVLRSQRAELLASNIANSDTPGYKAKDMDFKVALENAQAGQQSGNSLKVTHKNHIQLASTADGAEILYRVPNQASLDGNTVDSQMEKTAFAENAMRYEASLRFLSGKFRGLLTALKGE